MIDMGVIFMAQRRGSRTRSRLATRRYGLKADKGAVAALVAVACVAGGTGVLHQVSSPGLVVERAQGTQTAAANADDATNTLDKGQGGAGSEPEVPQERRFVVHVDGAVGAPGVVELTGQDVRVYDAVTVAGGLTDEADTTSVNLAEPLSDGAKIHIPHVGEQDLTTSTSPVVGQAQTSGATGAEPGLTLVNINTATAQELQVLSGVGEATADAIIQDREQNGPFSTPEDLMRVSGIGEKKFAKLRDHICV